MGMSISEGSRGIRGLDGLSRVQVKDLRGRSLG